MARKKSVPNEDAAPRQQAEEKTRAGEGANSEGLSPEQTQQVIQLLRVQLIELEEQNQGLRQKQVELETGWVEKASEVSEIRLAEIYNSISDTLFVLAVKPGDNFRFISVNRSFLNVTGLSKEQVVGKRYQEVIPAPAQAQVLGNYKKAILEKKAVRWEEISVYPAGKRYGEVSITPVFDASGECSQLIGTVHDITERKLIEDAIKKRNQVLSALHNVALEIGAKLELPVLLKTILLQAQSLLDADRGGAIYLYDARENVIRLAFGSGINEGRAGIIVPMDRGVASHVFRTAQSLVIDDYTHWAERAEVLAPPPPSTVMGVPLLLNGQVTGILSLVANSHLRKFTKQDVQQAEMFAAQAAIVIRNAQLYQQAQQEISERKQAEDALKESEARYRRLHESMTDCFSLVNMSGEIVDTNPAYLAMLGYSEQEIYKLRYEDLTPERWHAFEREIIENQILPYGHSQVYEKEYIKKDGTVFPVELRTFLLRDVEGKPSGMWAIVRDITGRKQAEQALRESEDKFKYVFDHSVIGKSLTLPGGEIDVNQALCDMLGYSQEELKHRKWQAISHPDDIAMTQAMVDALLAGQKESARFNKRYLHKNGSVVWTDVSTALRRDESGQPLYFMTSIVDITERKRAEDALRKNEAQLRAVLDATPFPIALVDGQGQNIEFWSRSALTLFGHTEATAAEWYQNAYPDPDYRREVIARWNIHQEKARISGQTVNAGVYRITCRDGSIRLCEMHAAYLADKLVVTFNDITERKQAEEKLEEERILLRTLIDNLPDRIYVEDTQGRKILSNIADWQASGGKTMEDVIGKTDFETYPPELAKVFWALEKTIIDSGVSIINHEEPGLDPQGNPVWVLSSKVPLRDSQGKVIGLVGIGRDISVRKQAEEALRALSSRQEAILDAVPDILMEVDNDRVYTWANPAGFDFFGEDVIGKEAAFYFEGEQDTYVQVKPLFNGEENVIYVESWQRRKDGEKRLLAWRCRALKDANENVIGVLSLAHDITETRRAEHQLAQYSEHLEEMVKERTHELSEAQERLVRQERLAVMGQLAGGVGHELRNPLAIILNAVYYLKLIQPDADDNVKEYLHMIEHETHTAEKIITDLLDFARIKSVEQEQVAVADLVRQTLERFPVPAAVAVAFELPPDLPLVYADPGQMVQVLGNLTVNACQAMPKGGKLTFLAQQQEQMVSIAVKDTGVGISPENMRKLFEPLFTTKLKGIGLGLAVSQKLVEANAGRIEVESEPGVGSTFTLFLPLG